jgi:hypothetical protein
VAVLILLPFTNFHGKTGKTISLRIFAMITGTLAFDQ